MFVAFDTNKNHNLPMQHTSLLDEQNDISIECTTARQRIQTDRHQNALLHSITTHMRISTHMQH